MSKLQHVSRFTDLKVYQLARRLSFDIYKKSSTFPKEEIYSLTGQIRRSLRSIGAQIAEAWAKRRYERHFISKLTDADGEQQETQHWIEVSFDCNYINLEETTELKNKCDEIGRMLNGMISKSNLFCGNPNTNIRESSAEYSVSEKFSSMNQEMDS
jgi:four helix bundle protein